MKIEYKRVYEKPESKDGMRILVDRLWPRGLSKKEAKIDLWLKDIAPSTELRKWFGHNTNKWEKFRREYIIELKKNQAQINILMHHLQKTKVTLLYGAKDEAHNNAVVLENYLNQDLADTDM